VVSRYMFKKNMYAGKLDCSGNPSCFSFAFRHDKYMNMASKGLISPEKLPPSERAAYFHGLRAVTKTIKKKNMIKSKRKATALTSSMSNNNFY